MHWLWVVLIGLVAGALAKLIMPGKDPGGFIVRILLAFRLHCRDLARSRSRWYQEGQSAGFIMVSGPSGLTAGILPSGETTFRLTLGPVRTLRLIDRESK